jgi:hypothetical protein
MPAHRHDRKQPVDAIAMLKEDQQRVRDLFQACDAARDPRVQRVIAEEACTEIEIYAQMEEEIRVPGGGRCGGGGSARVRGGLSPGTPGDERCHSGIAGHES